MTNRIAALGGVAAPGSVSEPQRTSRSVRGITALLLIVLLLPLLHYFDDTAAPMDEGSLLVYPEQVLKGKVPYRDFETFYGPANLYLLSGVYALAGSTLGVERTVGLLYRVAILSAVFIAARRWSTTLALGCVGMAAVVALDAGVVAYAWMGAIACALWSLIFAAGETSRRCFVAGVLASGALLFRPDLGPAVILGAVPLWLRLKARSRWASLSGAAVGLLPLIVITIAAGPRNVIENLFVLPVFQANGARHLPLAAASRPLLWLLAGHSLAAGAAVVAGAVSFRKRLPNGPLLLSFALFAAGITHQALQRCDNAHALFVVFLSFGVLPLSAFMLLPQAIGPRTAGGKQWVALGAAALVLMTFSPRLIKFFGAQFVHALNPNECEAFLVENNGRSFAVVTQTGARAAGDVLDYLGRAAATGERLFVGPADLRRTNYTDTFLYHLAPQLEPATYFLEMNPGSANRPGSRLAADIATADWLILDQTYDNWREPNRSSDYGSDEPNAVVRTQFELSRKFGEFRVFRRKQPVHKSETTVAQF